MTLQVTQHDVDVLADLREKMIAAQVAAEAAQAQFRAELASVLLQHGAPIETSVVCFRCRVIRSAEVQRCQCQTEQPRLAAVPE